MLSSAHLTGLPRAGSHSPDELSIQRLEDQFTIVQRPFGRDIISLKTFNVDGARHVEY